MKYAKLVCCVSVKDSVFLNSLAPWSVTRDILDALGCHQQAKPKNNAVSVSSMLSLRFVAYRRMCQARIVVLEQPIEFLMTLDLMDDFVARLGQCQAVRY